VSLPGVTGAGSTTDVVRLTALESRSLIAAKRLSPVELVRALLERIDRLDPTLHAFVQVDADGALAAARRAEAQVRDGEPLGPLHGVPFAVKDVIAAAGLRMTAQSRQLATFVPKRDAVAVERLRRAGGVLLGKLTTHEFALGGPDFDLPWPPARNPWDLERFAGGSSSGSAVALAAAMVPVALGTDTGGSIRNPASLCGVVGLKPTYGAVSRRGMLPLSYTLDHLGPMTRTVADNELVLRALRGGAEDSAAAGADLRGLRIGVVRHFYDGDKRGDAEVVAAIDAAVRELESLGAAVEESRLDPIDEYETCGYLILRLESHVLHRRLLATTPHLFGPKCRERLEAGAAIASADYQRALARRRELRARLAEHFAGFDLLVTGAALEPAPPLDGPTVERHTEWNSTMPFNLTGYPAMVVPVGLSSARLPIAMQLVARPGDEATLARAGTAYERAVAALQGIDPVADLGRSQA
jgi:aspartyl-tRNA(Asn)/glutamyl-tRNA(Gln) amidotransferase subunit A